MFRTKVYRADEMKVLDEATGRVSAIVSSEKLDRDGDVIRAEGWNLDNFNQHPVLLASHDYHSLRSQIGVWEKMEVAGTTMRGVARFFVGRGNEEADWAFELAKEKALAFSVGFIPDMDKAVPLNKDDAFGVRGMEFKGQELLEVSAVTVPSNPDAIQRMIKVLERLKEPEVAEAEMTQAEMIETIVDQVVLRLDERTATATDVEEVEPSEDDDEVDEDDYGDGDEPEGRVTSDDAEEFDPYAVAAAAAEAAIEESD
jgi:hypothetical protein